MAYRGIVTWGARPLHHQQKRPLTHQKIPGLPHTRDQEDPPSNCPSKVGVRTAKPTGNTVDTGFSWITLSVQHSLRKWYTQRIDANPKRGSSLYSTVQGHWEEGSTLRCNPYQWGKQLLNVVQAASEGCWEHERNDPPHRRKSKWVRPEKGPLKARAPFGVSSFSTFLRNLRECLGYIIYLI